MFDPASALGDKAQLLQMYNKLKQQQVVTDHNGVQVVMRGDGFIEQVIVDGINEPRVAEAMNKAQEDMRAMLLQELPQMQQ